MTIHNVFDWAVSGRENTSPTEGGIYPGFTPEMLLTVPYRQDEFQAYADQLEGLPVAPLVGNRHYYCSDYMIHRRPNYVTSVHMYSTRIIPARCVNEQGKLSEHYGDGLNYLYYSGQEYHNVFGVWNWQQLPGITCEQNPELQLPCNYLFPLNASSFVGGVSDNMYGACGMQLVSHNLTSQKGFLFFDNAYVAANSNITCHSSNPVYTSVANLVLNGNVTVSIDGQVAVFPSGNYTLQPSWIHHGNTGYLFLDDPLPTVYLHIGQLNGNWISCGVVNESISLDTVSIMIDNTNPLEATRTAYVVVPDVSAEQMPAIAASQAGLLVVYTSDVHAAVNVSGANNNQSGLLEAIFWAPGNVSFDSQGLQGWSISASQPCMLLVSVNDTTNAVTITVSNPDTPSLAVDVSFSRALDGEGCQNSEPSDTQPYTIFSFVLPAFFGNSTSITCVPATTAPWF
jgi:chondroitin AC lyase